MSIYIYGDIGGHFEPFLESLARDAGVDIENQDIPEGTVIIQVGDLVHRGPRSDELVAWVDEAMKANPGQWIQLLGNHEGMHVGGPIFGQRIDGEFVEFGVSPESEKTLQRWYKSGQALMACAVERTDEKYAGRQMLITHAGLARQTWAAIGEPLTAAAAAKSLNAQTTKYAFAPGWLMGGYAQGSGNALMPPGVAWASAAKEVYPSWEDRVSLFDQVHGHSTVYHWSNDQWFVDPSLMARTEKWKSKRFTRWENFDGGFFYCIDQALGRYAPHFDVKPLKIEGVVLCPRTSTTTTSTPSALAELGGE